jgi:hypothetical protein
MSNQEIEKDPLLLQSRDTVRERNLKLAREFIKKISNRTVLYHIYTPQNGEEVILEWAILNQENRGGSLMVVFEEQDIVWVSLRLTPDIKLANKEREFADIPKAADYVDSILDEYSITPTD